MTMRVDVAGTMPDNKMADSKDVGKINAEHKEKEINGFEAEKSEFAKMDELDNLKERSRSKNEKKQDEVESKVREEEYDAKEGKRKEERKANKESDSLRTEIQNNMNEENGPKHVGEKKADVGSMKGKCNDEEEDNKDEGEEKERVNEKVGYEDKVDGNGKTEHDAVGPEVEESGKVEEEDQVEGGEKADEEDKGEEGGEAESGKGKESQNENMEEEVGQVGDRVVKMDVDGDFKKYDESNEADDSGKNTNGRKKSIMRGRSKNVVGKLELKASKSRQDDREKMNEGEVQVERGRKSKEVIVDLESTNELNTPVASVNRPVRERKSVDRFMASNEKDSAKEFLIEKGEGTPLKDIPNVIYKLSKRKTDSNLKALHTILFGRRGKTSRIKSNISQFSGFSWQNDEGKQKNKVKEKLDKCVKDKLLDFCDVLDLPIKANVKKDDIVVKLLDFMVAPHATTDILRAEKDQSSKGKKRRRTAGRSGSRKPVGTGQRSAKKRRRLGETPKSSEKFDGETEYEEEAEEDEENENGIPDKDVDKTPENSEEDEKNESEKEDDEEEDGEENIRKERNLNSSSKKDFSDADEEMSASEEEDDQGTGKVNQFSKSPVSKRGGSSVKKGKGKRKGSSVKMGKESESEGEDAKDNAQNIKQGSNNFSKTDSSAEDEVMSVSGKDDHQGTGKLKQVSRSPLKNRRGYSVKKVEESDSEDEEETGKGRGSAKKSAKRGSTVKIESKKAKMQKRSPDVSPSKKSTKTSPMHSKVDVSESSPISRKKKESSTPKKSSHRSKSVSKAKNGENGSKANGKTGKEIGPSDEELRNAVLEILKEVDFNTATFTDILKMLTQRFGTELAPRKAVIKLLIQEELSKLTDEDGDEDEDEDEDE